jgi:hypothetical protein
VSHRSGNVHDSKQALPFLREVIDDLRAWFGRRVVLEFRMDAACRHWQPVAPGFTGHETELVIPQWHDLRLRVVLYRKHIHHETRRNFQLDLFNPDNGLSPVGAGRRGRPSPRSRASSRSTWSRRSTTRPPAPGSKNPATETSYAQIAHRLAA